MALCSGVAAVFQTFAVSRTKERASRNPTAFNCAFLERGGEGREFKHKHEWPSLFASLRTLVQYALKVQKHHFTGHFEFYDPSCRLDLRTLKRTLRTFKGHLSIVYTLWTLNPHGPLRIFLWKRIFLTFWFLEKWKYLMLSNNVDFLTSVQQPTTIFAEFIQLFLM